MAILLLLLLAIIGAVELGVLTGSNFTSARWLMALESKPFCLLVVLDTTSSGKIGPPHHALCQAESL
uniref:Uncharacterized protein n=1 Tax=Romanomermis culicivorax TaxID=13658 RepID=A0A915JL35_ROMCU